MDPDDGMTGGWECGVCGSEFASEWAAADCRAVCLDREQEARRDG